MLDIRGTVTTDTLTRIKCEDGQEYTLKPNTSADVVSHMYHGYTVETIAKVYDPDTCERYIIVKYERNGVECCLRCIPVGKLDAQSIKQGI